MRAAWWWLDRWRKSTARTDMTLAERGAYRELLDECWLRPDGILPNDDRVLARIALCTPEEWAEVKPAVMSRFTEVPGGVTNETAQEVIRRSRDLSRRRSDAGKKGNEVRWKDHKPIANAIANGVANASSPSPSPSPSNVQRTENDQSGAGAPRGEVEEVFFYWIKATGRTGQTVLNERRRKMLRARLAEEPDPDQAAENLKLAIDGAVHDPFYSGQNDRGKRYWELPNIFRNRDRVEELQAAGRRHRSEAQVREALEEPREPLPEEDPEAARLWAQVTRNLAVDIPGHSFRTWLTPTRGWAFRDDGTFRELLVVVPSAQHKQQIRTLYRDRIREHLPNEVRVRLVVGDV